MDAQAMAPLTANLTASVLAHGTTTTLSQTNAATYAIKGKLYAQASAWSNTATPTKDWATGNAFNVIAANQGSVFAVGLDSTKTMRVIQGTIEALDTSGNFIRAPMFGGLGPVGQGSTDNDFCPVGYIVVKNGSTGSNWTFGTNNYNATGITFTCVDVATLPDRPQVA